MLILSRGYKMNLTPEEVEELQEQIILIYRAINQKKLFNKFFCGGIAPKKLFKNESSLIKKLNQTNGIENLLKECIIELEEIKKGNPIENEVQVSEIVSIYNLEGLYKKYGMRDPLDTDKLDIKRLLKFL